MSPKEFWEIVLQKFYDSWLKENAKEE